MKSTTVDGKPVKIDIIDTAGQEEFKAFRDATLGCVFRLDRLSCVLVSLCLTGRGMFFGAQLWRWVSAGIFRQQEAKLGTGPTVVQIHSKGNRL